MLNKAQLRFLLCKLLSMPSFSLFFVRYEIYQRVEYEKIISFDVYFTFKKFLNAFCSLFKNNKYQTTTRTPTTLTDNRLEELNQLLNLPKSWQEICYCDELEDLLPIDTKAFLKPNLKV